MESTLILLVLLSSAFAATYTDFGEIALSGYRSKKNFDYFISHYRANREQANYDCRHVFSGRLLTILTKDQDDGLNVFIEENSGIYVLTSGSNVNGTTTWCWDSNLAPGNYTNWRPDHPIMHYGCLCVGGARSRYGWYSVPCTNDIRFICEV